MKTFKWIFVAALALAGSVPFADWAYERMWERSAREVAAAGNAGRRAHVAGPREGVV